MIAFVRQRPALSLLRNGVHISLSLSARRMMFLLCVLCVCVYAYVCICFSTSTTVSVSRSFLRLLDLSLKTPLLQPCTIRGENVRLLISKGSKVQDGGGGGWRTSVR